MCKGDGREATGHRCQFQWHLSFSHWSMQVTMFVPCLRSGDPVTSVTLWGSQESLYYFLCLTGLWETLRCLSSQSPTCHVDTSALLGFPSSLGILLPFCSEIPQVVPLGNLSLSPHLALGAEHAALFSRDSNFLIPPLPSPFLYSPGGHFSGQQGSGEHLALLISSSKCF